jgi:hypothetical protein
LKQISVLYIIALYSDVQDIEIDSGIYMTTFSFLEAMLFDLLSDVESKTFLSDFSFKESPISALHLLKTDLGGVWCLVTNFLSFHFSL